MPKARWIFYQFLYCPIFFGQYYIYVSNNTFDLNINWFYSFITTHLLSLCDEIHDQCSGFNFLLLIKTLILAYKIVLVDANNKKFLNDRHHRLQNECSVQQYINVMCFDSSQ
jgi:hypothetical protein